MVDIASIALQMIGNRAQAALFGTSTTTGSTNTATTSSLLSSLALSNSNVYSTNAGMTFDTVLQKLNNNIDNADMMSTVNSLSNSSSLYGQSSSSISDQTKIDVSSVVSYITQQMKDNPNSSLDVNTLIKNYLTETYGSQAEVIKNIAGVNKLPSQMQNMESQIFNNIVSKIAVQVRENLYSKITSTTDSLYYGDDSSDTTSTSDTDDLNL